MSVWLIPAVNTEARENYIKTLCGPVSAERQAHLPAEIAPKKGRLFAWGFPNNDKNLGNYARMLVGDICFFYMHREGGNRYQRAARVSQLIPKAEHRQVSLALWDSPDFLPYLLDEPVEIDLSPEDLGKSLTLDGSYCASPPQGANRLMDEARAAHAISRFGSFDEWALDLIEQHSPTPAAFVLATPPFTGAALPVVTDLLRPMALARGGREGTAAPIRRYSKLSKMIGDAGEQAVLAHLRATLSEKECRTLVWVANQGRTPGWDIEYYDAEEQLVAVEVKATTCDSFPCFEMTENERRAAEELGDRYHLYLVGNCRSSPKTQIIRNPWAFFTDRFVPTSYRVGLTAPSDAPLDRSLSGPIMDELTSQVIKPCLDEL